ncbi:lipopolysaccharide biosynthesis protein [Leptolinea tardivitalis]|uniref:Polysaccharide biosynthesis protein C-terminal domain-containing protein n=1 Tax=Leptolinea tardivitalis TaxID=229920 RepID=A0A0P6WQZ6_9CHLR|nr:oligosaccharide flippase family protein [Leptolinea tardivitalis]KPL71301.1 hypothetical protein ADM99_11400 [Leptolinea tardivitalis]GAP23074.1 membrane protein [Leptolinea tardivitalis]
MFTQFLEKIKKSIFKDIFSILTGTVLAQLINVIAIPIITRLYTPEQTGSLAIFISITGVLTIVSSLRYELAIILPDTFEEASNILVLCFLLVIFTTFLVWILTISVGNTFLKLLNASNLFTYLWVLPLLNFFTGIFQVISYWNTRFHKFGDVSIGRVTYSGITSSFQVGLGLINPPTIGILIHGVIWGNIASTLVLFTKTFWTDLQKILSAIDIELMKSLIYRYRKFPLYSTGSGILNYFSWQLPTLMLAAYFSPSVSGLYDLGNKILRMPMNLIGVTISQAFLPRAAEAQKEGHLSKLVENSLDYLVLFTLFPLLVLTITGSDLFFLLFGKEWAEAGVYTQILSIWMFFWFISSPISNIFLVLQKQEFSLKLDIVIFISRFISLLIGGISQNPRIAILLFALSGIIVYGFLCVMIMNISGANWKKLSQYIGKSLGAFIPLGCLLSFLTYLDFSREIILLIAFLGTSLYYSIIIWKRKWILKMMDKKLYQS